MPIARRQLLKTTAAMAASVGLGRLSIVDRALGQGRPSQTSRRLIVVLNSGGWDTTFTIDPKPGAAGVDVPGGTEARIGEHRVWSSPERPAVDAFFERFGDLTAVVNGLQVRSFVHPDCLKRVLTGSPSETTPDLCAVAAFEHARDLPVPYLALGGEARSGHLAAITGRTGTVNQLSALVDPLAGYPNVADDGSVRIDPVVVPDDREAALVRDYLDAAATRLGATRGQRAADARRIDEFRASLTRADALKRFARDNGLGERDYTLSLEAQIPLTIKALQGGLSHTVLMQTDGWDTHQNNAEQGQKHDELFAALGDLMSGLSGAQMLDDTLVVVLSEMGRTPRLNAEMGKDHWPVTSAMLVGAAVVGNRTYGGTDGGLDAASIDYGSGIPDPNGKQLQAGNFVAGILTAVGVDPGPYLPGVEPFDAFVA